MIRTAVLCFIVFSFCNSGLTSAASWDYKNQELWPKLCSTGKQQSPIALSEEISEKADFEPFQFHGYDGVYSAAVNNNGHTVEITINSQNKIGVSGGGLNSHYLLKALHFHWESEHTIEGQRFPLELHLVHYDNRSRDLSDALSRGGVAVLGVLFYLSPDDDSELSSVFDAVEKIQNQKVVYPTQLDDFLPRDRAGFYRYKGSLTTPDCTEGLTWTVFTNPIPISANQLKLFSNVVAHGKILGPNYRPLQDLNDRKVLLKKSDAPHHSQNGAGNFMRMTVQMLMLFAGLVFMM